MNLDTASRAKLPALKPDLAKLVERAAVLAGNDPLADFQIVQGNRTQAEQNKLYAQGRTAPGKIVTWTKNSKHIGGGAIDFAAMVGGKISWDEKLYPPIAAVFKKASSELGIGIVWGGDWDTKDWGHIELNSAKNALTAKPPVVSSVPVPLFVVLKKGSSGDRVLEVQRMLLAVGINVGPIDGDYGDKTVAAVKQYQKLKGLDVDGKVGPMTWTALQADSAKPVVQAPKPPVAYVRPTKGGPDFVKLQQHYEAKKNIVYVIDGIPHCGWGHADRTLKVGSYISDEQCQKWFDEDKAFWEGRLNAILTGKVNQKQYDAILSIVWNGGNRDDPQDKTDSPLFYKTAHGVLIEAVNSEDWTRASAIIVALGKKPTANGTVFKGIERRRLSEDELFRGVSYTLR